MNRRSTDAPLRRREDQLEELLEHGSRNFRRYRRRAYVGFLILAVACAWGLKRNGDTADQAKQAVKEVRAATAENKRLALAIQQQRKDSIRSSCRDQNRRHRMVAAQIDAEVNRLPPEQRAASRRNGAGIIRVFFAAVPRQNCDRRVRVIAPKP